MTTTMNKELVEKLVNAFLSCQLPSTVCSDQCLTVRNYPHQRLGTSLLNADEARQMVEHLASALSEARKGMFTDEDMIAFAKYDAENYQTNTEELLQQYLTERKGR